MLTMHRRDRRVRRQADFQLEYLDRRLVLSAAAGAAAADVVVSRADLIEHRHEARLARIEARHDAKVARHDATLAAVDAAHSNTLAIPINGNSSTSTAASASASAPAAFSNTPNLSLLSGSGSGTTSTSGSATTDTSGSATTDSTNAASSAASTTSPGPLPANVSAALQSLYGEYEADQTTFKPVSPSDSLLQISGDNVEVNLQVAPSTNFNTALSQLGADGMQVSSSSATYGLIDGMLPISALSSAASIAMSVTAPAAPLSR